MTVPRRSLLVPVLASLLAACGAEPAPDMPTYARDVQPLMFARCVRCHGAGGTLNNDPGQLGTIRGAPLAGYFDHYEDTGDCSVTDAGTVSASCHRGAATYALLMVTYVTLTNDSRMLPPPTPRLTDREIDIIKRCFFIKFFIVQK